MKRRMIRLTGLLTMLSLGCTACAVPVPVPVPVPVEETSAIPEDSPEVKEDAEAAGEDVSEAEYIIELDPQYNVPTEELLKSFPIKYETPAETELSKKIQNRMLNGFNRWNMGYDAWEHWGEVLYHEDSIYNVNGVRMTLPEYQTSMDMSLKKMDIRMGDFNNMILVDDWMAIRYDITNTDRETGKENPGTTMEFARFGDYGELGAKVDEGWGGSKNENYTGLLNFLTEEEKEAQDAFMQEIADTVLPETDDLEEKYPVVYPTTINTELGKKIKAAVLQDFENWNAGYETWKEWADELYTDDLQYDYRGEALDLESMKSRMQEFIENSKRVRINNILVSEDWAAIHFYDVTTDENGDKEANNHMQFLHFTEDGDRVKIDMAWAK